MTEFILQHPFWIAALLLLLTAACTAHYKLRPGALNTADSAAYDTLLIAYHQRRGCHADLRPIPIGNELGVCPRISCEKQSPVLKDRAPSGKTEPQIKKGRQSRFPGTAAQGARFGLDHGPVG